MVSSGNIYLVDSPPLASPGDPASVITTDPRSSCPCSALMLAAHTLIALAIAGVSAIPHGATLNQYTGGDTSGCGKTHILNAIPKYRTFKSGDDSRGYLAHLPANYDKNHQYPVIVGFHGSSSIGLFFEVDTGLDKAKYTADKIMIYPNGLGGAWAGANYSEATVEQDLQFVWDLLGEVRKTFCVDSARIYATGISMGGGFVDTIACNATVGGEFAAFAPASGSFYTNNQENHENCKPARVPTPMLEFHGGADESVHYQGGQGEGGLEPAIPDW